MTPKLFNVLLAKFPDPLGQVYPECGDGWFSLIYELLLSLEALEENIHVAQIKEKFGTLRFYTYGHSAEADSLISATERTSGSICEYCGLPGSLRGGRWLRTLCDACADNG